MVTADPAISVPPQTSHTIYELITATHREPRTRIARTVELEADEEIARLSGFPVGTSLTMML
ncbi:hypothetical protein SB782_37090, partial [Brevibacillus sp. SIMBA_076]|uniref:hypothetical protein n=1 Tax=Brevibacillus sp. SIMBA_076 TaxID=3085814 RepID=UPI00397B0164